MSVNGEATIKVLIIDPHEAVRRALRIRLNVPRHLQVVGAVADPAAAVPYLLQEKPDVILLGLQNGSDEKLLQTALAVRELAKDTAVVIVLAPYADAIEREMLMQAGAKRYLLKHINSPQLIHEIESVTARGPLN